MNPHIGHLPRLTNGKRRGFSLLELAIVVSVVAGIVLGIFVAAKAAHNRMQVNQGGDEIGLIVNNMKSLYTSQNTSAVVTQPFSAALEQRFVQQGVFPAEMLIGGFAYNSWDRTAANGSTQIALVAAGGGNPSLFVVRYLNIPAEACADLLVHTSLPGSDTQLFQIIITGGAAVTYTNAANQLPVTPINAAAACPAGALYTIDWYYALGS